jgi:hypothetical protein
VDSQRDLRWESNVLHELHQVLTESRQTAMTSRSGLVFNRSAAQGDIFSALVSNLVSILESCISAIAHRCSLKHYGYRLMQHEA